MSGVSQDVVFRGVLPIRTKLVEASANGCRGVWVVRVGSNDHRVDIVRDADITAVDRLAVVDDQLDVVHGRGDGIGVPLKELKVTLDAEIDEVQSDSGHASSERIAGVPAGQFEPKVGLRKIKSPIATLSFGEGSAGSVDDVSSRRAGNAEVAGRLDRDFIVAEMHHGVDAIFQDARGDFASGNFFDQPHIGSSGRHRGVNQLAVAVVDVYGEVGRPI